MKSKIVKRKACRAVILTPENEILLIRIENPSGNWRGWITPGGGMEPGESEEVSLARELDEEIGFENAQIGSKIWTRFLTFPWHDEIYEQSEVYFLVRTEKFEVNCKLDAASREASDLIEFRWWHVDEVVDKQGMSFAPRKLPELLRQLVREGPPPKPIDVGE